MDHRGKFGRLALLLGLGVAAGCATPGGGSVASSLAGTAWVAEEIAGQAAPESPRATLSFEAAEEGEGLRAAGSGGCNRYFGPVEVAGETIAFGPLAATKRACEPAVMEQEGRFFEALGQAARFEVAPDGALVLLGEDGARRARLIETAP